MNLIRPLIFVALAAPAAAAIDLVALPSRDRTELTIYNPADLTLVRETRMLTFRKGPNEIQFSWAGVRIDQTSLQLDTKSAALTLADARYPAGTADRIVWTIEAAEDGSYPVEISYFASGLSWQSRHIVRSNAEENALDVQTLVRVANQSGEDFETASVRVVVGEVNVVEPIAEIIDRWIRERNPAALMGLKQNSPFGAAKDDAPREQEMDEGAMNEFSLGAVAAAPAVGGGMERQKKVMEKPREIIKKAVSEYRLYTIDGEVDLPGTAATEFPNPVLRAIPFALSCEIDARKHGSPEPVSFYKFHNDDAHKLGKEPIPDGGLLVLRDDPRGGTSFVASTSTKYVPVGGEAEWNLGRDPFVIYEERLSEQRREAFDFNAKGNLRGWNEARTATLKVRNARARPVPLKFTHYLPADTEPVSASLPFDRVDKETIRWEIDLPPGETVIELKTVTHFGTRRKNV